MKTSGSLPDQLRKWADRTADDDLAMLLLDAADYIGAHTSLEQARADADRVLRLLVAERKHHMNMRKRSGL